MTKDLVIIGLGIWIAALPFLGFPNSWDRILFLISGLFVSVLMFLLRRDFFTYVERLRRRERRHTDTFVENNDIRVEPIRPESREASRGSEGEETSFSENVIDAIPHEEARKIRKARRV